MLHVFHSSAAERDLILAIVSPLLTIFFLVLLIREFRLLLHYRRYHREVTGRVTALELREGRGGRCLETIVAEYTADGRTCGIRSAHRYPYSYYRVGDEIPLRVSEKDPERAMMPYDVRITQKRILLFGILFLFLLLCTVLVL